MSELVSERQLDIDLSGGAFPYRFAELAAAKYPNDRRFLAQAVSFRVQVTAGSGSLTIINTVGANEVWPFAASEPNNIAAVGIAAASGVTRVKVFLQ